MRRLLAIALIAVALVSCGDDDDDDSEASDDSESSDECLEVPQTMLEGIANAEEQGVGMEPVEGAAWKSPDYEDVTFIAMRFSATGVDDQVGVWAMNNFETGSGLTLAVDGFAEEFTVLPDADTTDAQIPVNDPGVAAAKDCLG